MRLRGPTGNPDGVGAILRLVNGNRMGPAREIHAGSGYWSQDSAVQVLAGALPARVWTRWPGGRTNIVEVPAGAREMTIAPDGTATLVK